MSSIEHTPRPEARPAGQDAPACKQLSSEEAMATKSQATLCVATTSEPLQLLRSQSFEHTIQLAMTLIEHSRLLRSRHSHTWLLEDVEERIKALRDSLETLSGNAADLAAASLALHIQGAPDDYSTVVVECLLELSVALGDRYKHVGQPKDLDEQVNLLRLAFGVSVDDATLVVSVPRELGAALRTRFFHVGDSIDILEAFKFHSSLLDLHPVGDPNRPRLLYELAHTLYVRSTTSRNDDDLVWCTSLLDDGMKLMTELDPYYSMARYVLAKTLWARWRRGGDASLLHASAAIYRDLLHSLPLSHPDRWMVYYSLGSCMGGLYEQTNDIACLNEALECGQRAIDVQDSRNPNRVLPVLTLTSSLMRHFRRFGDIQSVHRSIEILQSCIDVSHYSRPPVVSQLATSLNLRYDVLGAARDLDEGIQLLREVVISFFSPGHPQRHIQSNNLAMHIFLRYQRDKIISDISEAIDLAREAFSLSEKTDFASTATFNLVTVLCQYYKDIGGKDELEEAIALCETWFSVNRGEKEHHGWFLQVYAEAVRLRYESHHRIEDLSLAILRFEEALDCLPEGHVCRPETLIELAEALQLRFNVSHSTEDAERAVKLLMNARGCLPDGNPNKATPLFKLSRLYLHEMTPFFDLRIALKMTAEAVTDGYQNAQKRLSSVLDLLEHLEHHRPIIQCNIDLQKALLEVYTLSVDLLPRVAYFGLDAVSRLRVLGKSDQLAANGAAHALLLNQSQAAIELLEQGRAVFWSQHLRLRTEFSALPSELAAKLSQAAFLLERGSTRNTADQKNQDAKAAQETETAGQRRLGEEFEALIGQARALPGFERFMLPETFHVLGTAASHRPLVVLLANDITCQAIVIVNPETIRQVRLPEVSSQQLRALAQVMTMAVHQGRNVMRDRAMKKTHVATIRNVEEVLSELWRKVVQKIVDVLQLKRSDGRSRPRLTLCPTGVFAHLPLHAAGIYRKGNTEATECFSDYLVPSYTSTIGALLNARRKLSSTRLVEAKVLIAAVSRPFKWAKLPFVAEEIKCLRDAIPSHMPVDLIGDIHFSGIEPAENPSTNAILERLPNATILHLACHGYQNPTDPLESGFVMQDTMLTVAKLMELNLDKAFFAFLSACETAKGDKAHSDQAIHLAAAMLFAGFKSVVGTMWSMGDADGPIVAGAVYEELYRAGAEVLDPDAIPYALDFAVRKLREKGLAASRWAPYAHFGI